MPKKTGICINAGGKCPNALNRKRQVADVTNFKCEHCGGELREYKGPVGPDWKKIGMIAAGVLLIGGLGTGGYLMTQSGQPETEEPVIAEPATTDSGPRQNPGDENGANLPPAPANGTDLGYAVWTGQVDNDGRPNDSNGRMYFKERHRISPNDDRERYAEAGESIVGEYVNGKLVQGKWYKKDKNVESILLGN